MGRRGIPALALRSNFSKELFDRGLTALVRPEKFPPRNRHGQCARAQALLAPDDIKECALVVVSQVGPNPSSAFRSPLENPYDTATRSDRAVSRTPFECRHSSLA